MLILLSKVVTSICCSEFRSASLLLVGWVCIDSMHFVIPLVVVSLLALSMVIVDMYAIPQDFSVDECLTMGCLVFECACVEC